MLVLGVIIAGSAFASEKLLKLESGQFESRRNAYVNWQNNILSLRIHDPEWSGGVKINPPKERKFDFSHARYLACDVENLSKTHQMRLTMHISSGERDANSSSHVDLRHRQLNTGIGLNPGEKRTMRIYLPHAALFTAPGNGKNLRVLDTANINFIEFQLQWPFEAPRKYLADCEISNLRLENEPEYDKKITGSDNYFPFIDVYGQYIHSDWPEKIHNDDDLIAAHRRELAELDKMPAPVAWNEYGGWKQGPKLEATGYFRVEKHQGKWFFVDPSGRLFWSTGIDVIRTHSDPTARKNPEWFAKNVPKENSLPFTHWNLQKKYGRKDYQNNFYNVLVRRLRAWGINTIGNWGAGDFMMMGKVPYTMQLADLAKDFPHLAKGVKFYDVFHPEFELKMGNILRDRAKVDPVTDKSINDPMCIGYFIDNELKFSHIIKGVMMGEPKQPAKAEFLKRLKAKYNSIEALNKSWETDFADWEAMGAYKEELKSDGFRTDSREFQAEFIERYFKICQKGIKSVAPHRLYLGCRFVGFRQSDDIWRSAAKYCDVLSINTYSNSIANVITANFHDKPVIVGEFHFGTLDRGMFLGSLCPVGDQQERAISYTRFVQGALLHPNFVGTHWFQFRDQPLTGRWDGEGYQIGFVDVADTPYEELCKAAREVGENMYQYRINNKYANSMSNK